MRPATSHAPAPRVGRALLALLIAAQAGLTARPALAADKPADQIGDALVSEAEARGGTAGDEAVLSRLKLAFESSGRAAHGLVLARFYARSGRLLDALSVYRMLASQEKDQFRNTADADAAQQSKPELEALVRRVPRIYTRSASAAHVVVDGKDSAPNAWVLLDPGKHGIDASAPGFAPRHVDLTLAEGDHSDTSLLLIPLTAANAPVSPAPIPAPAAPTKTAAPAPRAPGQRIVQPILAPTRPPSDVDDTLPVRNPRGSSQRLLGYLTIGWGVAALLGGGVTAYLAHQKRQSSDGNTANTLTTVSDVAFIAGGGITALGLAVVLTAPHGDPVASSGHERLSAIFVTGRF